MVEVSSPSHLEKAVHWSGGRRRRTLNGLHPRYYCQEMRPHLCPYQQCSFLYPCNAEQINVPAESFMGTQCMVKIEMDVCYIMHFPNAYGQDLPSNSAYNEMAAFHIPSVFWWLNWKVQPTLSKEASRKVICGWGRLLHCKVCLHCLVDVCKSLPFYQQAQFIKLNWEYGGHKSTLCHWQYAAGHTPFGLVLNDKLASRFYTSCCHLNTGDALWSWKGMTQGFGAWLKLALRFEKVFASVSSVHEMNLNLDITGCMKNMKNTILRLMFYIQLVLTRRECHLVID